MHFLKKLRIILQSNKLYIVLIFLTIINVFISIKVLPRQSKLNINENYFICKIIKFQIKDTYVSLELKSKDKISGNYYFKNNIEKELFINSIKYGDYIKIKGKLLIPKNNTNPNQFNYKKYLYNKKQFYILKIEKYIKYKSNNNILYKIKNNINNRINSIKQFKVKNYLNAFILGNNDDIDINIRNDYKIIGISHLLAISGMHVSIFAGLIYFILKKININEIIIYLLVFLFLFLYCFITNFLPSILRATFMYVVSSLNKLFKIKISNIRILIIVTSILLIINSFFIYDIGFLFSIVISFYLIVFKKLIINKKNYITKLLMISFISFLSSIPILIYISYEVNLLSILYNVILVPFVTFVIFPFSIITFILPIFSKIYLMLINVFEFISIKLSYIPSNIILKKPSLFVVFGYFIIITIIIYELQYSRKNKIILLIGLITIHYNYNIIFPSTFILMLDVGQGDCILLHSNNHNILIDTGGTLGINNSNVIINVLKSYGIRKIDYLFITHGDYDHIGNAKDIINTFKTEKVIFNSNNYNDLEKKLINFLNVNKINYKRVNNVKYTIGKYKIRTYYININPFNENDNSLILQVNINGKKILFMGDSSINSEKQLLSNYKIGDIDILKIGHHGSKTSTSNQLLKILRPKYSLISVGKNNLYNHPSIETINKLNKINSKIFLTSIDGAVMIKFKKNVTFFTYNP